MVSACTEGHSLRNVLCAVIQVEKAQEEGEPITTHDRAKCGKGPRCNTAILDRWEIYQPRYGDKNEEPL